MNKYISLAILVLLASCVAEPVSNRVQPCEDDSLTVVDEENAVVVSTDSARSFSCDSLFHAELKANLRNMTDDQRVSLLANSNFWLSDTLTRQQFVVLFNYLLDHQNDKLDNQIGDFMFEHFQTKSHFADFDCYYKLYSDPSLLEALTFAIISSWKNENESITEKDFKNKFGYLYNNGCIEYFRMLESLEK